MYSNLERHEYTDKKYVVAYNAATQIKEAEFWNEDNALKFAEDLVKEEKSSSAVVMEVSAAKVAHFWI